MLPSKRPFLADEELGKKYDDCPPPTSREQIWLLKQWKPPRRRRFFWGLLALCLIYLLLRNIPTDPAHASGRSHPRLSQESPKSQVEASSFPPLEPPPRDESVVDHESEHYYGGNIRLISLPKTLPRFQNTQSRYGKAANRVVMFSGASLTAVSDLLPLACRMANQQLNEVHFALMGRDGVSVKTIQHLNGITNEECRINWHDARPDYAQWSTDARMEGAAVLALGYLQFYLRPQVMITHGVMLEDSFFAKGVELGTRKHGLPHIALPSHARELMWMSLLHCSALRAWNEVQVEILIQAPSKSSGSIIRLLRSLEEADYLGSTPSLTVELPQYVDPQLLRYLQDMKWLSASNKVTVRRHIQTHTLNPAEAAMKAAEAFYPRNPNTSHVLMLSPQTELSPSFYHYLKYAILKYRYSCTTGCPAKDLFGISLELPSSLPTNGESFTPPRTDSTFMADKHGETLPLFLWQIPNSNAALYFGDKWMEFHSFLSSRLTLAETKTQSLSGDKVISKKYPAGMEYLLELMRASGYYMLYPAFEAQGFALATVHNELYQTPEEFTQHVSPKTPEAEGIKDELFKENVEKPVSRASTLTPLLDQFSMSLPAIETMPLLSCTGRQVSRGDWGQNTREYIQHFRIRYGGCSTPLPADASPMPLFCMDDER